MRDDESFFDFVLRNGIEITPEEPESERQKLSPIVCPFCASQNALRDTNYAVHLERNSFTRPYGHGKLLTCTKCEGELIIPEWN